MKVFLADNQFVENFIFQFTNEILKNDERYSYNNIPLEYIFEYAKKSDIMESATLKRKEKEIQYNYFKDALRESALYALSNRLARIDLVKYEEVLKENEELKKEIKEINLFNFQK